MKRMHLGVLGLVLLTSATLVASPALAKTSKHPKSQPTTLASFPVALTRQQAVQVVEQYFRENNVANSTLSVSQQSKDEEGISARMDNANYSILFLEGQLKISAGTIPKPKTISVYLTNANKAPVEFLAAIKYPGAQTPTAYAPYTYYILFRKDSKRAPWRALYEQSITTTKVPKIIQNSGQITIADHASTGAIAAFAKYLNSGKGQVDTGSYTSTEYNDQTKAIAQDLTNNIDLSFSFKADRSPVNSFAVKGGTLEFAGLDEVNTTSPGPGLCGVDSLSTDSAGYLALVPSGIGYTKIVVSYLAQVVIFVPASKHSLIKVLGANYELISASTPPAANCSSS